MDTLIDRNENLPNNRADWFDRTIWLPVLRCVYGDTWQLGYQVNPTAWFAIRRHTSPALEVHYALNLTQLRNKLENATQTRG
jgi:hypothetical protein